MNGEVGRVDSNQIVVCDKYVVNHRCQRPVLSPLLGYVDRYSCQIIPPLKSPIMTGLVPGKSMK